MIVRHSTLAALVCVTVGALGSALGCSGAQGSVPDHHGDDGESVGTTSSALVASDPVSKAVTDSCGTASVKGLALQLLEQVECLSPGVLTRIDNVPGFVLGEAVVAIPFLQTPAAKQIIVVQKARGTTMTINSALRTLPQQYLLYQWSTSSPKRCGIQIAAPPGGSNHEQGLAVDVEDNGGWISAMHGNQYRQLSGDLVHFNYMGGGELSLTGLSVKAFQILWNVNNPNDKVPEDGSYGGATESRLVKSPIGGFAKGPNCVMKLDAGTPPTGSTPPVTPGEPPTSVSPAAPETAEEKAARARRASADLSENSAGCAMVSSPSGAASGGALTVAAAALIVVRRRRRRPSAV